MLGIAVTSDLIRAVKKSQRSILVSLKPESCRHASMSFILVFAFALQCFQGVQYF
ncbi:hypothetical protein D3C80_1714440 [compost metagenome]